MLRDSKLSKRHIVKQKGKHGCVQLDDIDELHMKAHVRQQMSSVFGVVKMSEGTCFLRPLWWIASDCMEYVKAANRK